jgi:hypothetical protein
MTTSLGVTCPFTQVEPVSGPGSGESSPASGPPASGSPESGEAPDELLPLLVPDDPPDELEPPDEFKPPDEPEEDVEEPLRPESG